MILSIILLREFSSMEDAQKDECWVTIVEKEIFDTEGVVGIEDDAAGLRFAPCTYFFFRFFLGFAIKTFVFAPSVILEAVHDGTFPESGFAPTKGSFAVRSPFCQ